MAVASTSILPVPSEPILAALTNGTYWILPPDRNITWGIADSPGWVWGQNAAAFSVAFGTALSKFSEIANVRFTYTGYWADVSTAPADIVLSATTSLGFWGKAPGPLAGAYFPNEPMSDAMIAAWFGSSSIYPNASGDLLLNMGDFSMYASDYLPGSNGFFVMLHELGHALGLKHPHDNGGTGRPTFSQIGYTLADEQLLTIMSYEESTPLSQFAAHYGWPVSAGYPASLMPLDVVALQSLYGPNLTTRAGDTIYSLLSDQTLETFWDAGGRDLLTAQDSSFGWFIQTFDGGTEENITVAVPNQWNTSTGKFYFNVEDFFGSFQADEIHAGSGANVLAGLGGNDLLDGGAGNDTVMLSGSYSDYRVEKKGNEWITTDRRGLEGTDRLVNIEILHFGDKSFDLVNPPRTVTPAYGKTNGFLFDAVYFLLDNPELVPTQNLATALQHYYGTGAAQGKAPNSWFDPTYYENKWADLTPLHLDDATLFMHYNLYGVWEGRSGGPKFDKFDGNRYLHDNPDVAAYVDAYIGDFLGSRTNGAIAHYVIYGSNEGRAAFDLVGQAIDLGYTIDLGG